MGLSSFNRMRRLKADVAEAEAARFEENNKARHEARALLNKTADADVEAQEAARQLEVEAVQKIGEKITEGLENDDLPMRQEHAAEIAGRTVVDPQGEPVSPVDLVRQRLPEGTANEELVEHTSVDADGPSAELVEAAQKEAGIIPDEARQEAEAASDQTKPENDETPEAKPDDSVSGQIAQETAPEDEHPFAKIEIIDAWEHLDWPAKRALASQLSDSAITNKVEAEAAIKAELDRRASK